MNPDYYSYVDSPVGRLLLTGKADALMSIQFPDANDKPIPAPAEASLDETVFKETRLQLNAFFNHDLMTFDIPLALHGSDFQLRVWDALQQIPYGQTWSYQQLATAIGSPGASRAVGRANNANPIPIIIPCHRVIGADGSLVGFGGGLARKRKLLISENTLNAASLMADQQLALFD